MKPTPVRVLPPAEKAAFVDRPNRFLARARLGGRIVRALMPNPGRMGELLLPGAEIWLADHGRRPGRKTRYHAVAVRRGDSLRLLDTHKTNDVAEALLEGGAVSAFRNARFVRREIAHGRSRFDFLLEEDGEKLYLEVKSCNLIEKGLALFPDARTDRGRRHLLELAEIAASGEARAGVLFVVHDPGAEAWLPNVHCDLPFARALDETARRFPGAVEGKNERFRLAAAAIRMREDLTIEGTARELPIPIESLRGELEDRGSYLILLRLPRRRRIEVGALGSILFPAGWYLYAGSAERGLGKRIERHRRLRKKLHWHIDYLRKECAFVEAFPVRSSRRDECDLAAAARKIADGTVDRFGSSDCACPSHLFRFDHDPRAIRAFQDILADFRHRLA